MGRRLLAGGVARVEDTPQSNKVEFSKVEQVKVLVTGLHCQNPKCGRKLILLQVILKATTIWIASQREIGIYFFCSGSCKDESEPILDELNSQS